MVERVGHQLGHYRLLRKIGQGTFAEVYLGEHLYLERLAAIKVLHVQMETETHEQFRHEARTIANLQHPHIVQVHDFGLDEQTPYLVMEYTPGGTLHAQHPKGTRLPFEQIVTYVKQIASALDYAHQQRVIHRDVKPANLLLNARGEVVLSDFGLAVVQRTLESLSTQEPAGTPLYMAPEQIRHHPYAASDQYALGIMVYQWLCGQPPFQGQLYAVLAQHLSEPPPGLCERLPNLPVAVEEAVFKALAKDPEQRFACVADFASALEHACSATQPLTLQELAQPQTNGSFSTQPEPLTMPRPGRGQEAGALIVPGLMLHPQSGSKGVKPSLAQSNRQRFLRRVRAFWIEGVLDHSLHGAALIALGLQGQRDALANPWHLVLQHPDTAPRAFPAGTRITQVYDAANGELLILGAPGSGKTTLLLELARDLLDRAEDDEHQLMPVVFNLSSWAGKQQPLTEWMIEELISKYQVPRKQARAWVDAEQILPLLDGLDEVAPESRSACIATINTYREEHGLLPFVVASRSADYLQQTGRLRLSSAVSIQALTQQQVEDYLASGGESLQALQVALQQDAVLRELTETPLMLSILTLTYQGMPVEELLREGSAPTRQQIFERYVERVLRHRGGKMRYMQEQTKHWLSWLAFLASQMQRQKQTVFYVEYIQPSWLSHKGGQFYRLSIGLIFGLLGGLIFGLLGGLIFGLFYGLGSGLLAAELSGSHPIQLSEEPRWPWKHLSRQDITIMLAVVLGDGLLGEFVPQLFFWLIVALGIVLIVILFGGLPKRELAEQARLRPNQGIWRSARNGLLGGLVFGLLGGLVFGLLGELLGEVLSGLVIEWLYKVFGGSLADLAFRLLGHQIGGILGGLGSGLIFGFLGGILGGLNTFLQHFTLRLWLWRANCFPWNLVAFLDEAAERLLLRKVGGGYIFVHRLLLEYFASLDTTPRPDAFRAKKQQGELVS